MKTDHKISLAFCFFVLFSGMATAQLPAPSINPVQTELQTVTVLGYQSQTDVIGAPYSAIEESLYSQRQPDGTYDDRSSVTTHIYRDGQGRTRAERYVTSYLSGAGDPWLKSIFIVDPVAGVVYSLDPKNHRATRSPWNETTRALSERANSTERATPTGNLQSLTTTTTLEGLTVEWTQQTLTVPAGGDRNDRSFNVVVETWFSPELKVAVLTTRNTSGGRRTTRLTLGRSPNCHRAEVIKARWHLGEYGLCIRGQSVTSDLRPVLRYQPDRSRRGLARARDDRQATCNDATTQEPKT